MTLSATARPTRRNQVARARPTLVIAAPWASSSATGRHTYAIRSIALERGGRLAESPDARENSGVSNATKTRPDRREQRQRGHHPERPPPLGQDDPVGRQRGRQQHVEAAPHPLLGQHRRRGEADQQQAKGGLEAVDEREELTRRLS